MSLDLVCVLLHTFLIRGEGNRRASEGRELRTCYPMVLRTGVFIFQKVSSRKTVFLIEVTVFFRIIRWCFSILLFAAVIGYAALHAANYFMLQTAATKMIQEDSRNEGLVVTLRYQHLYNYKKLVIDYRAITPPAGPVGVFRSLFQLARFLENRKFDQVILAYRGTPRFLLDGDTFISLGARYGNSKPLELILHMANNLRFINGDRVLQGRHSHYATLLESKLRSSEPVQDKAIADDLFSSLTQSN